VKEGKNINIAPMGTASFFSVAGAELWHREKDIVDSGLEA